MPVLTTNCDFILMLSWIFKILNVLTSCYLKKKHDDKYRSKSFNLCYNLTTICWYIFTKSQASDRKCHITFWLGQLEFIIPFCFFKISQKSFLPRIHKKNDEISWYFLKKYLDHHSYRKLHLQLYAMVNCQKSRC